MRIAPTEKVKALSGLAFTVLLLAAPGCLVRKVVHVHAPGQTLPARDASLPELVAKIAAWGGAIHTMTASIELEPTAGSVYSGVIKQYHDVPGYILLQRPSTLRLLGQAPLVRTNIFDMVSDGENFRLYIPTEQKFIIGKTTIQHPAKNALENLRPQHILQALILPPIDPNTETTFREKAGPHTDGRRYFVVYIVAPEGDHHVTLRRKVWFDRADLELVRVQFYAPDGTCTEDVHYSNYRDFKGIHYPTHIELDRPEDNYQVAITIEKATFNEPIPAEKFDLKIPQGVKVINLGVPTPEEPPHDQ